MPDTRGFEIVAEVTESALQEILRAAWDSGGTGAPGSFPHEVEIPAGSSLAGYSILQGQAQIKRENLLLTMAPAVNGVQVQFLSLAQIALDPATVPVPSLQLITIDATIGITTPFGTIAGSEPNIGVIFDGMPRNQVSVVLNADPIGAITPTLVEEYLHALYQKNNSAVFPHTKTLEGCSYLGMTFDAFLEFYSDPDTAEHKITAQFPDASHVKISFPIHLRLYDITSNYPVQTPMGVYARLEMTAPYSYTGGIVSVNLTSAVLTVTGIVPGPGTEGTNYTTNKTFGGSFGFDVDALMSAQISTQAGNVIHAIGPFTIAVPTNDQIATRIGDFVHQELLTRKYFGVWTPTVPEGTTVTVSSVRPKALSETLAIGINALDGADENSLTEFIPSGARFAIALDGGFVNTLIQEIVDKSKDEGGLGGLPCHYDDIDGYAADLNSLNWTLQDGKIHFTGNVTVYDVFCGANADVEFWADVGLRWTPPDASGAQTLEPYVIDKDADLPWWAWLLAVITFLAGVILGIIAIVITAVIEGVVDKIGGEKISDEVAGKLQMLGAWPQQLQGIGTIETQFDTEVGIDSSGLLFHGPLTATSSSALTAVYDSDAGGPYASHAAVPVDFHSGWYDASFNYAWELGDGSTGTGHIVSHPYIDNGLYTVRLATQVLQSGGALTHYHVPVRIKNTAPVIDAGPNISIDEGKEITLTGVFEDIEFTDTHEAYWDFGDDSKPQSGILTETHTAPKAKGSVIVKHAWGDNGDYVVRFIVKDKDGGVSVDTRNVHVANVPPTVTIEEPVVGYPGIPVHLIGNFTDPGWLDTHIGFWHIGDAPEVIPATIYEVNEEPFGFGIAVTTHIFERTGTYCAECIVIDDDGGKGRAKICIPVVELVNRTFEKGFRKRTEGTVANAWEPYSVPFKESQTSGMTGAGSGGHATFEADEFVVCQGQRAQRIYGTGRFKAGIYQTVLANKGWEYQVNCRYHCDENTGGYCRVGIDPEGGITPDAAEIIWVDGKNHTNWSLLSVRAVTKKQRITVFLEVVSDGREANAFFDNVELIPYPCPAPMPLRPDVPKEESKQRCVDFSDVRITADEKEPYVKNEFSFTTIGNESLSLVLWGEPADTGKMRITRAGIQVQLPFVSQEVTALVSLYAKDPVLLTAFDAEGKTLASQQTDSQQSGNPRVLKVSAPGISSVKIAGGSGECLLVKLCVLAEPRKNVVQAAARDRMISSI